MSKHRNEAFIKLAMVVMMSMMVMYVAACVVSFVWYWYEFARIGFSWDQVFYLFVASFNYAFLFNQYWNIDIFTMLFNSVILAKLYSKGISFIKQYIKIISLNVLIIVIVYIVDFRLFHFLHDYQRSFYPMFAVRLLIAVSAAIIVMELIDKSDSADNSR